MFSKLTKQIRHNWSELSEIKFVAIAILTITVCLLTVGHFGGFQSWEL